MQFVFMKKTNIILRRYFRCTQLINHCHKMHERECLVHKVTKYEAGIITLLIFIKRWIMACFYYTLISCFTYWVYTDVSFRWTIAVYAIDDLAPKCHVWSLSTIKPVQWDTIACVRNKPNKTAACGKLMVLLSLIIQKPFDNV